MSHDSRIKLTNDGLSLSRLVFGAGACSTAPRARTPIRSRG
ncbi:MULTISPECIES: hypothetical protein [unclassified Mesorhizobium]|nr:MULTISPECIES: hypothetical protein [unclassified Mesorhizobium]ESZ42971.1 hypothetical protein X732_03995 [Mesorhizobium sp. L2C066B000]